MFLIEQGEIQKWSLLGTVSYDQGSDKLTIMEISQYGQMQGSNRLAYVVMVKIINPSSAWKFMVVVLAGYFNPRWSI